LISQQGEKTRIHNNDSGKNCQSKSEETYMIKTDLDDDDGCLNLSEVRKKSILKYSFSIRKTAVILHHIHVVFAVAIATMLLRDLNSEQMP